MWTRFMDMHSGGGCKENGAEYIYIEAPEKEAISIFYAKFGHNPNRVSCTCCGEDYSISESESFEKASAYDRGCLYVEPLKDPKTHRYLHDDLNARYYEKGEPIPKGYTLRTGWNKYQTVEQYKKQKAVLILGVKDILLEWRKADVSDEDSGYEL
jgi:hypothetical protein